MPPGAGLTIYCLVSEAMVYELYFLFHFIFNTSRNVSVAVMKIHINSTESFSPKLTF